MGVTFAYTARNTSGAFVAGALEADDFEKALAHLRTRALFVTSLEESVSSRGVATSLFTALPVSPQIKVAFFRSLATMTAAGVPLRRALEVSIEVCRDGRFREALHSVASEIEAGGALSVAMARRPREFSQLFVAMVKAGEIGGALERVLERLATLLERDREIRKRVVSALTYPAIVAASALALVLFLIGNTVPAFAAMFAEMHVALPFSTRLLIAAGEQLHAPLAWFALLSLTTGMMLGLHAVRRSPNLALKLDEGKLLLPGAGQILRKVAIARFARTLGTLLESGVPILSALRASQDVMDNLVYRRGLVRLSEALENGEPLTSPLTASNLFDPLFLQLVRVGEESGTLPVMLLRIAAYCELDVETALSRLGSIVEPISIVLLGAVVGTIVASILIPLYSLIGSMK